MKPHMFFCLLSISVSSCKSPGKIVNSVNDPDYAIAYNIAVKDSAGKSNYEVFVMNMDGSNARNISNNPDVAWTYRAYKKNLYFISDRDTCYRCFFSTKLITVAKRLKRSASCNLKTVGWIRETMEKK